MNVASVSTLKGWRKVKSVFHIRVIALTLKLDLIGSILMLLVAVKLPFFSNTLVFQTLSYV